MKNFLIKINKLLLIILTTVKNAIIILFKLFRTYPYVQTELQINKIYLQKKILLTFINKLSSELLE